ncbi:Glutathione S-transferase 2 [Steccherinum ochraceum]|uniref:Glutathione S-transferase 2 n=1 Tax=Steccherinum ochraceum TaxID=92696 RepID=A0A4R0RP25_9APHY|nr:Glutathione S-transferase 2 [Steccherinum ochraceum]
MPHGKQFTLYTNSLWINGWAVVFVLNRLGLSYDCHQIDKTTVNGPEYLKYNPNGRIPTLVDHKNNDFAIWESAAIVLYLVDRYDPNHQISVTNPDEKATMIQWLFFQAAGQGPYYGQAGHFLYYHSEKVPSAIERYQNETRRVLGVLESVLSKQEFLVGGKLTVADIIFVHCNIMLEPLLGAEFNFEKEFPATFAWHSKVTASDGVKEGLEERQKAWSA